MSAPAVVDLAAATTTTTNVDIRHKAILLASFATSRGVNLFTEVHPIINVREWLEPLLDSYRPALKAITLPAVREDQQLSPQQQQQQQEALAAAADFFDIVEYLEANACYYQREPAANGHKWTPWAAAPDGTAWESWCKSPVRGPAMWLAANIAMRAASGQLRRFVAVEYGRMEMDEFFWFVRSCRKHWGV